MIAISKYHPQQVSSCVFCLKISVSWKMGMTSGQCAEMLHYIMCWFSPPQRDLYMGCPTPYSFIHGIKNKCQWLGNLWWKMLPPACTDKRPVTPESWGWSVSPCITVGLSQTWKQRLKHLVLLSVPHCVCRAVWPDLLLIYLPDNSSSLEEVMRTSWPCQTLSHYNARPPNAAVLYVRTEGFELYCCCSKVFSSRRSKG